MLIGYARTSTAEQEAGLEAQKRDLKAAGCEKVFAEHVSSVAAERAKLAEALTFARAGDCFIVTKPCRLARTTVELLGIAKDLKRREIGLRILAMGGQEIDTSTAMGELLMTLLAGIAQFERANMLERQRQGIAKAAKAGKYKGRAPTVMRQAKEIQKMAADGVNPTQIAKRLNVARSSVYLALKAEAAGQQAA